MSEIKHKSAGSLKKGDYVVVDEVACSVTDVKISRPGKHGHAKVNLMAVGLLDGKKRSMVAPGHDHVEVPVIDKRNAQVLSVSGDKANVMDVETYETFDLEIPSDFGDTLNSGDTVLYWVVLQDKVLKQKK